MARDRPNRRTEFSLRDTLERAHRAPRDAETRGRGDAEREWLDNTLKRSHQTEFTLPGTLKREHQTETRGL